MHDEAPSMSFDDDGSDDSDEAGCKYFCHPFQSKGWLHSRMLLDLDVEQDGVPNEDPDYGFDNDDQFDE